MAHNLHTTIELPIKGREGNRGNNNKNEYTKSKPIQAPRMNVYCIKKY